MTRVPLLQRGWSFILGCSILLAMGLGAVGALSSVLLSIYQKPLELPHHDQLGITQILDSQREKLGVSQNDLQALRDEKAAFTDVASYQYEIMVLKGRDRYQSIRVGVVSENFFKVLGIRPFQGSISFPKGDRASAVVHKASLHLLDGLDGNPIGREVRLNNRSFSILGILPENFRSLDVDEPVDVWISENAKFDIDHERGGLDLRGNPDLRIRRTILTRSVSNLASTAIQNVLDRTSSSLRDASSIANKNIRFEWQSLESYRMEGAGRYVPNTRFIIFTSLSIFLLVILDVTCLLHIRSQARSREMSIRIALGANLMHVIWSSLKEIILIGLIGLGLGISLSYLGGILIGQMLPLKNEYFSLKITLSPTLILLLALITTLGLVAVFLINLPILFRRNLASLLNDGSRGSDTRGGKVLGLTLMFQLALCVLLISGALVSFLGLKSNQKRNLGLDPKNLVVLYADPSLTGKSIPESLEIAERAQRLIKSMPGVQSATLMANVPMQGRLTATSIPDPRGHGQAFTTICPVGEDLVQTLKATLLYGQDIPPQSSSCLVNRAFMQKFFPDANPVGQSINVSGQTLAISGVLEDMPLVSLKTPKLPCVFMPFRFASSSGYSIVARSTPELLPVLAKSLNGLDAAVPILEARPFSDYLGAQVHEQKLAAWILSVFSISTFALTVFGAWGIGMLTVKQRKLEMGIRMMLGATPLAVVFFLLKRISSWLSLGYLIGITSTLLSLTWLKTYFFGLPGIPWFDLFFLSAILFCVPLLGALIPATKISRSNPLDALRNS
jgi:putative ABC transport system permease protein